MSKVTLNQESLAQWMADNAEGLRYKYDIPAGGIVIDIGGCIGDFFRPALAKWPHAMFVVFEPTDYANNIPVRPIDNLVKAAAWVYDGEINLAGSFFATSEFEDGPKTAYKCVDIAKYLQQETALVKINIEGSEINLIAHMINTGVIKNIQNLQVQFHMVGGIDSEMFYQLLKSQLELTHDLQWRYPFVWESWKRKDAI